MPPNLPTDLLRSFTVIVDAGTLQKATERIYLTQSALSLQMKRLEDLVQTPLFLRDGRRLAITPAGATLLGYARRMLTLNDEAVAALAGQDFAGPVRVGMVQDVSETLLTGVLAQFAQLHPRAQLQARVAGTLELLEMLETDRLDIVAGFGPAGDPTMVRKEPMRWLGNAELLAEPVLPLAVLEKPCRFREAAIAALDAAGRPYRVVLETPNLSTGGSAGGLGYHLPHCAVRHHVACTGGRVAIFAPCFHDAGGAGWRHGFDQQSLWTDPQRRAGIGAR